jgi:hypothetical protein
VMYLYFPDKPYVTVKLLKAIKSYVSFEYKPTHSNFGARRRPEVSFTLRPLYLWGKIFGLIP